MSTHTRFYYPDASVVCEPNDPADSFQDNPAVIVEVLSEATRRVDLSEKLEAYLSIEQLHAYLILEQTSPVAVCYRRGQQGFDRELYTAADAVIDLPSIQAKLTLGEAYENV